MNKNTAFVSSDEEIIYIGNENTVREISTSGKVLRTVRIINRRMDETSFSPSDGSEEFIISYKNGVFGKGKIHSSDCKLKSTELKEDGAVKKAVFCFEPYRIHSSDVFVKVIFEARDSDPRYQKNMLPYRQAPRKNCSLIISTLNILCSEPILKCAFQDRIWKKPIFRSFSRHSVSRYI